MTLEKPVLLFDGDCAFCSRWADRWRILAGGKVAVEPYQNRAQDFPEIPAEEFKKSVFLFEEGRTSRAAEAVFRLMSYNPRKKLGLWLYEKLPFFRTLSEKFYAFAASQRVFFSKLTDILWGRDLRPDTYFISRQIFYRGLGLIYACAFASLAVQITGLIGRNGILPAQELIAAAARHFKGQSGLVTMGNFPTVFWFGASDFHLQAVCVIGVALSFVMTAGFAVRACLLLLWFLYLSLSVVGRDFLSFQWDSLLVETGCMALFWAPAQKGFFKPADWKSRPPMFARAFLVLLLFKLMISSGLVKLASGDPAWRDLTAVSYHYETQPLPNTFSWFAHRLPMWCDKLSAAVMFAIELAAPVFLFFPRNFRRAAVFCLIFLQLAIMFTGNYGFFNFLALLLCLTMADDLLWTRKEQTEISFRKESRFRVVLRASLFLICFLISSNQVARLTPINFPWKNSAEFFEKAVYQLRIINNYGLFAVMTQKRGEIIIEGSNDGNDWKAYEFKYKPGNPEKMPAWIAPYQPRLDWQMWFAALSRADRQPWFVNLCTRLLRGTPEVLALLANNPFPEKPPLYIRASMYRYQFTTPEENRLFKTRWKREYLGLYLPPITLNLEAENA